MRQQFTGGAVEDPTQDGILIITDYDRPGNHIAKVLEEIRRDPPKLVRSAILPSSMTIGATC